ISIYIYIHLLILLLAEIDMEPKLYMQFFVILTPLHLKHVGTNHFQRDKSIKISE
uniref:Uncharacterized protein n=1 Tax=Amphimedon queenslandica TaxID=400682 RepID=A0A1X7UDJ0_AMPQE